MARQTISSLKAQRSSRLPPPRVTTRQSIVARSRLTCVDGRRDLLGGPFALHADGHDQHVGPPPATPQHLEEIADRRARGTGHHGDLPREPRQRPFPGRVEKALPGQLLAKLPQGQLQGADPLGLDLLDDQLVLPLRRVDAQVAPADHLQAVVQLEPQPRPWSAARSRPAVAPGRP